MGQRGRTFTGGSHRLKFGFLNLQYSMCSDSKAVSVLSDVRAAPSRRTQAAILGIQVLILYPKETEQFCSMKSPTERLTIHLNILPSPHPVKRVATPCLCNSTWAMHVFQKHWEIQPLSTKYKRTLPTPYPDISFGCAGIAWLNLFNSTFLYANSTPKSSLS